MTLSNSGMKPNEVVKLTEKVKQLAGLCHRESLSFVDRNPSHARQFERAYIHLSVAAEELNLITNDPDDDRDKGAY